MRDRLYRAIFHTAQNQADALIAVAEQQVEAAANRIARDDIVTASFLSLSILLCSFSPSARVHIIAR